MTRMILVVALMLTAACGSSTPTNPSSTRYTVSGTVRSGTLGPLAGASVRAEDGPEAGRSILTNGDGRYTLSLAGGTYRLRVSAPDHALLDKQVTLAADTVVDFDLKKIGS